MNSENTPSAGLVPPDFNQCQACPNVAGYSFMTLGPMPTPVRCEAKPVWVASELVPAQDGLCGSMSLCQSCADLLLKRLSTVAQIGLRRIPSPVDALDRLIEAVELGDEDLSFDAIPTDPEHPTRKLAFQAYHDSIDAGRALCRALLPGWIYDLTTGSCFVCPPDEDGEISGQFTGESPLDGRAFLLAVLRGYRSTIA